MKIKTTEFDNGDLIVNNDFIDLMESNGLMSSEKLYALESETVKSIVKERGTSRAFLSTERGDRLEVYIKRYTDVPLKEKLKLKLFFKPKTADAFDEWRAICRYHESGLKTMLPIAAGRVGDKTCNLTLGITDYVRASDLFRAFKECDSGRKEKLIKKIAEYCAVMHSNNMAHQDLYLVHFFVKESEDDAVYLIDLQRTIIQPRLSRRWHVKDLAQLLFSAEGLVSEDEISLFWDIYTNIFGAELKNDGAFIKSVRNKAARILARDRRKRTV